MTERDDDDDLNRLFAQRRERSNPDALAAVWEKVEARIGAADAGDEQAPTTRRRPSRAAAGWFGAGFAAAAAIASLVAVSVRDRAVSEPEPVATAVAAPLPVPNIDNDDTPPLDDSSRAALADAERAYEHALDVVEADYLAKRDSLPPDVAVRMDASFRDTRKLRGEARSEAGSDVDARLLLLDTYAVQLHTLQATLDDME